MNQPRPDSLPKPRATVARMHGYTPGEQPPPGVPVVKLNTNENPFPPSPRVMEVIRNFDPEGLRRYPHPTADRFRDAVAELHGVAREQVIAGNGSDDVLNIILRTYVGPGEAIVWPEPTYSLYPVLAEIADIRGLSVPWSPGWRLPIDALCKAGARAVFFANPNAPSGTLVSPDEVRVLARQFPGIVLVDEAYADFAGQSCLALLDEFPNVVVTRTLSKGYALCGLRLGYAVAAPAIITELMKVKDSYNCNAIAIDAGAAALGDQAYTEKSWATVRGERERVAEVLRNRGFDVIPSHANFLLATVPGGDAGALYRGLKARGVLVRFFDKPGLSDKLRISIGRPDENDALLAGLAALTPAR
ncbi:MAG TPA: histidinol-phosphate transaminase [Polyangia bacterium]